MSKQINTEQQATDSDEFDTWWLAQTFDRDEAHIRIAMWSWEERGLRAEAEISALQAHRRLDIESVNKAYGEWNALETQLRKAELESHRLLVENWQLKGALGYAVPGDIPPGEFRCGMCAAKDSELAAKSRQAIMALLDAERLEHEATAFVLTQDAIIEDEEVAIKQAAEAEGVRVMPVKKFDVAKMRARLKNIEGQCQQKRYSASAYSIAHTVLNELERRDADTAKRQGTDNVAFAEWASRTTNLSAGAAWRECSRSAEVAERELRAKIETLRSWTCQVEEFILALRVMVCGSDASTGHAIDHCCVLEGWIEEQQKREIELRAELDRRDAEVDSTTENRETLAKKIDRLAKDLRGGRALDDVQADLDALEGILYDLLDKEEEEEDD